MAVESEDVLCGNLVAKAWSHDVSCGCKTFPPSSLVAAVANEGKRKDYFGGLDVRRIEALDCECMIVPVPNFVFSREVNEGEKRRPVPPEQWTMQLSIDNDKE